ncbi:MAG: hypothetical protein KKC39_01980 [Candidatus Omnitrophica bacterium]|nr:hypothetical protein [Candidatus Omnitrophota bacterium]MBU4418389.1 hypothetical protein [Candidatus Omnitrophota bacterium]MBU4467502.1 hypothetical protein [Candidatus Omnitrophota bacterium]MCG2713305.1 hypothetical protein [Candidatus Omnitrophota bacterium]
MAEYSICLALVLAALLGMQLYVKRGLQGRYRELVDHAAKQAASPKQYEPYYVQDEFTVKQSKIVNEDVKYEGLTTRDSLEDSTVVKGTAKRGVQ